MCLTCIFFRQKHFLLNSHSSWLNSGTCTTSTVVAECCVYSQFRCATETGAAHAHSSILAWQTPILHLCLTCSTCSSCAGASTALKPSFVQTDNWNGSSLIRPNFVLLSPHWYLFSSVLLLCRDAQTFQTIAFSSLPLTRGVAANDSPQAQVLTVMSFEIYLLFAQAVVWSDKPNGWNFSRAAVVLTCLCSVDVSCENKDFLIWKIWSHMEQCNNCVLMRFLKQEKHPLLKLYWGFSAVDIWSANHLGQN